MKEDDCRMLPLARRCEADLAEQQLFFWAQADEFAQNKTDDDAG